MSKLGRAMPRQRIISQDVARRAGVSRTTVSFVLNGVKEGNISDETRARVLAAAAELGYVPDATAQALATGRSRTIGLVFTRSNPHANAGSTHIQIIEGLMEVVRQFGVRLLVDSVGHADTADSYLELARTKRIDGLILFDLRADDRALYDLVHDEFPIVLLGRLPDVKVCSVEFDNRCGAQAAVEHLLAQGHLRIGLIAHGPLAFTGVAERVLGYQDALATAGIAFDETLVRYGDFGPSSGFAATMSLLAAPHERGIAIPDAMAVVGFDDQSFTRFLTPPLTTVRISFEDMGRQAGKMLLDLIHDDIELGCQVLLDAELIIRASSIAGYSL